MELVYALADQLANLIDGNARSDERARMGIVIESVEQPQQPVRHTCATARREALHLREAGDRQNSGHDRYVDAGGGAAVAEAQIAIVVEEELRNRPGRAGIHLALQVHEVGLGRRRLRMDLWIGGDRNFELGTFETF